MKITQIAKIKSGQDGAIWNKFLFRFDSKGNCYVYDLKTVAQTKDGECQYISSFRLDMADKIAPHSNSVMFGKEYYCNGDEFPLLYTNIYNNYAKTDTPMKGVCLVYRLQRDGFDFFTTLVQIIEIGFVNDSSLWKSPAKEDIRPYGNFVIDSENSVLYAFTMRDESNTTRYFAFDLPKSGEGVLDSCYNVKRVVLDTSRIKDYFDCEYHRFLQGAAFKDGRVYSLEGFSADSENKPAMRIVDVKAGAQIQLVNFEDYGFTIEPELIDFDGNSCYYCDNPGNLCVIEF